MKTTFRNEISNRYGTVYASSVLSRRGLGDREDLFAPVAIGPGDVAVFTWPAIPVDESWLEPA